MSAVLITHARPVVNPLAFALPSASLPVSAAPTYLGLTVLAAIFGIQMVARICFWRSKQAPRAASVSWKGST